MGGFARWALALSFVIGCASEEEPPTVLVEGQTFSLSSAIVIDATSAAVMNVTEDACGAFFEDTGDDRVHGEAPMLLGAFAYGPTGVLIIDDDDPRTYVTIGAAGDYVSIEDGVLAVHLTFANVVRQVRVGIDWYIDIQSLDEPITVEQSFATLECDQ